MRLEEIERPSLIESLYGMSIRIFSVPYSCDSTLLDSGMGRVNYRMNKNYIVEHFYIITLENILRAMPLSLRTI